jgi:rootletin
MYITATLEMELEQALLEKSDVHETLMKLDNINKSHVQDKVRQQDDIKKVKIPFFKCQKPANYFNSMQLLEENNNLRSQCTDHQNDIESLRKDILQAEQNRLDLESEKITLQEKIKYCEMEKEKVICALHLTSMWLIIFCRSTLSCLK